MDKAKKSTLYFIDGWSQADINENIGNSEALVRYKESVKMTNKAPSNDKLEKSKEVIERLKKASNEQYQALSDRLKIESGHENVNVLENGPSDLAIFSSPAVTGTKRSRTQAAGDDQTEGRSNVRSKR